MIVERAWGTYEILTESPRYKVKRLIMQPGQQFSHQYHHHRQETWTIVRGSAVVIVGGQRLVKFEGDTILIPTGADHKLSNEGKIPVEVIEVQYGSYLEEDDIVRLDGDSYGTAGKN